MIGSRDNGSFLLDKQCDYNLHECLPMRRMADSFIIHENALLSINNQAVNK